ncbi:MAG: diacylglycerol/lipid kinase family protein [Lachnospiraceae bacterium]|jgi:YegS/Rv2252/BmrU family lipid kinase
MEKILFIVNPCSGKEQIRNKLIDILDMFTKAGFQIQTYITQSQGDARKAAERFGKEVSIVVCSGGDGTLNETISGIMNLEQPPLLGYVPAGSTNDFASSLMLPKNMLDAAKGVTEGTPYAIDIGQFGEERYFVYIAAFGAFTEISYQTPQDKKNLLGHQAYMLEGVKSLASLKSYYCRIECDEMVVEDEFIFGMVTNTISVGGFKGLVTQSVALNDGLFEVLLIRTPKTPKDLSNIISYMFLKEEPNDYVYKFKTRQIRVISEKPIDWVLDGEFGGSQTDISMKNLEKRLEILISGQNES